MVKKNLLKTLKYRITFLLSMCFLFEDGNENYGGKHNQGHKLGNYELLYYIS